MGKKWSDIPDNCISEKNFRRFDQIRRFIPSWLNKKTREKYNEFKTIDDVINYIFDTDIHLRGLMGIEIKTTKYIHKCPNCGDEGLSSLRDGVYCNKCNSEMKMQREV